MLQVSIKDEQYEVEFEKDLTSGVINGTNFNWDIIKTREGGYNIIYNHKSYNAQVIDVDFVGKTIDIKINGNIYNLKISDEQDQLLKALGMEAVGKKVVKEIPAPMPGLVLDILVKEGQSIAKGDGVLVLEAMKMENILKSPVDGVISGIKTEKGNTVNKGEILVTFE